MSKQTVHQRFTQLTKLGLLGGAMIFSLSNYAFAQPPASAEQAYHDALQQCEKISDEAQRHNCKRDAAAALHEARRNPEKYQILDEQTLLKNRTARCEALPAGQKELCLKNMQEADNTHISGSVFGGGVLRRTTITEHGDPYTVPAHELPEDYQNNPNYRVTIKKINKTTLDGETTTQSVETITKHPTSNAPAPLKAKEAYGAHPVRTQ